MADSNASGSPPVKDVDTRYAGLAPVAGGTKKAGAFNRFDNPLAELEVPHRRGHHWS